MKLKLIDKIERTKDIISFIFAPAEELTWQAGQFLHYVLHHEPTDDRGSDRWFTISSAPFEKNVMLTTRLNKEKSSSFKNKLQSLEIGKNIEVSYLEGDFIVEDPNLNYLFIAGGIGITPYRSIIKQLEFEKNPINITLLYANRDQDVVFKDELESIAKNNPNFKIHYIFSPVHIDENKVKELVPDYQNRIVYVSGPEVMVEALLKMLREMGMPEDKIKGDWFPNYPEI
jgi:glycine betaine catabolism B